MNKNQTVNTEGRYTAPQCRVLLMEAGIEVLFNTSLPAVIIGTEEGWDI